MTSIRRKPTVLGSRRNTTEQEREHFQKSQEASFRKAINEEEVPVKMKHVRNLIIGTHTDRNGSVFWSLVSLSPPLHTAVTAWKFCHTLHLILRDGHANALRDSIQHISRIRNMGEHFRHLPAGYGVLIQRYCALLICKLSFHQHYQKFPGALQVTPEELEAIAENDANNYFEMAVEMLEYMEKILKLYEGVFDSLDPSRANSMTKMGQCRLSPLIPCIQDSSSLYDFIVRILFRLHKIVPTDMLSGHRTRFSYQFKMLQTFYNNTRNLQYFKTLIQVPVLPQVPPNFLIEAELRSHVAPVVVLEEEQPDPSEVQDSVLIDTTEPSPPPVPPHPHPDVVNSHNGPMMELMADRESMIEVLQEELRECKSTIQTLRSENTHMQEQLRLKINDLESTIAELDSELTAEKQSKESILAQVEAAAASAEAVTKLSAEETRRRTAEEKFAKMKEVYQKLRDEHITLIRVKAEMEKTMSDERRLLREEQDLRQEKEMSVKRLEAQLLEQNQMQRSVDEALQDKESLERDLSEMTVERDKARQDTQALQGALEETKQQMEKTVEQMKEERESLLSDILTLECGRDEKELQIVALRESLIELKEHLEAQLQDVLNECNELTKFLQNAQVECSQLIEIKTNLELELEDMTFQMKRKSRLLTAEVDDLNGKLQKALEENKDLAKVGEEKQASFESQLLKMKEKQEETLKELKQTASTLDETNNLKEDAISRCQGLEDANKELDRNLKELQENLTLKEGDYQNRLKESELLKQKLEDEILSLRKDMETLEEHGELELKDKQSEIDELEERLKRLTESKDHLANEKVALEKTLSDLEILHKDSMENAHDQKLVLERDLNLANNEIKSLIRVCDGQETLISDLRKTAEKNSEMAHEKQTKLKAEISSLEAKVKSQHEDITRLEHTLARLEADMLASTKENQRKMGELQSVTDIQETLIGDLRERKHNDQKFEIKLSSLRSDMDLSLESCVASAVESSITSIAFSLSHFDSEAHRLIKSTPDYTLLYKDPIENAVQLVSTSYTMYVSDPREAKQMVKSVDQFGNYVSSFLLYGKASSHVSPHIDTAENLVTALEELSKNATELLEAIRSKALKDDDSGALLSLLRRCCDLVCACEDRSPSQEDMATIVEREMEAMNSAIHEAVERFSKMLEESRAKDTGMQLEVNEGILATCGELMAAVRLLVQRASELQTEIVAAGRGGASPREFYKRNHRWTEGLISGAKTVAIACQALMKAADEVVCGKGKFEEVMVASKEIAASSMQLVMASRVKADKGSQKMTNLNMAAKTISTLTGTVVATAESCRDKVTEATTLDFSKLTLHSAKRLEMETLVKVLETEKKLETERAKLGALRKHHYQLAGELEGWEEEDMAE